MDKRCSGKREKWTEAVKVVHLMLTCSYCVKNLHCMHSPAKCLLPIRPKTKQNIRPTLTENTGFVGFMGDVMLHIPIYLNLSS